MEENMEDNQAQLLTSQSETNLPPKRKFSFLAALIVLAVLLLVLIGGLVVFSLKTSKKTEPVFWEGVAPLGEGATPIVSPSVGSQLPEEEEIENLDLGDLERDFTELESDLQQL